MIKIKKEPGYTLIELMAVMIVIVIIGGIVATILISSLRTATKTTILNNVRQNGGTVMQQMSKTLEFAQSFEGMYKGTTHYPDCFNNPQPQYSSIEIMSDNTQITYACTNGSTTGTGPTITSQQGSTNSPVSLFDTNSVAMNSCKFTCTQSGVSVPPTIGINFSLSSGTSGKGFDNQAAISFNTSVVILNGQKQGQ